MEIPQTLKVNCTQFTGCVFKSTNAHKARLCTHLILILVLFQSPLYIPFPHTFSFGPSQLTPTQPPFPPADSTAARHPITEQELPAEGWMRSPLCLCRRVCSSLVNTDKIALLRRVVDFLTSLAPVTTLVIILLLSYHSYQVASCPIPLLRWFDLILNVL